MEGCIQVLFEAGGIQHHGGLHWFVSSIVRSLYQVQVLVALPYLSLMGAFRVEETGYFIEDLHCHTSGELLGAGIWRTSVTPAHPE